MEKDNKEIIIKNKYRVKQHGEVFTPRNVVNNMISMSGLKEYILELTTTVLEPAVGEGVFLVELLKKRLKMVKKMSIENQTIYENLSLLALTSLYGIELLEDNAQKCVINIYQAFYDEYKAFINDNGYSIKNKVLESAKVIISANIVQGNFLTKKTTSGENIVFSEWRVVEKNRKQKNIIIDRTEHSIDDILLQQDIVSGTVFSKNLENNQLSIFDLFNNSMENQKEEKTLYKYISVKIVDVYKEEMEVYHG